MRKIIAAVAVACVLGAYAEERTVSTAQELYEAVTNLNGTGGTIKVSPGSYDIGPYNMGGYWNSSGAWKADTVSHHLALSNVTLTGTSMNPRDAVIYGNHTLGIFYCHLANLRNLTVSNGFISVTKHYGAGVCCTTRTGSVHSNVVVTCCSIGNIDKGNGGGIYYGKWHDCTIISNSVAKTSGGGCCYGDLYNCSIISNYAYNIGGGCYYGSKLYDCRVIGNRAATGGGVGTSDGGDACHVYGGTIAGNYGTTGGGSAYTVYYYGGTVVSNNVATSTGGGVYLGRLQSSTAGFVSNAVICCNTAVTGGGCCNGTAVGCEIFGNSADKGGGVHGSSCEGCTIAGNVATGTTGGGGGSSGTYTNCVISGNSAVKDGGGLYGCVAAVDCRIFGNTAASGGGCSLGSFTGCTITNNLATGAYGGGGYNGTYTNCLIACNSLLSPSTRTVYGGGLCSGVAIGCVIVSNTVGTLSSDSASISCGGGASGSQIIDSVVGYNQSTGGVQTAFGGGLYSGSASNCLIVGNAVWGAKENQGGGANSTALTNCIVRNNVASLGTGLNYGSAYGCVFSNNASRTSAAANVLRRPGWLENCEVVGTCMMACWAKNSRFVNYTNGVYFAEGENICVSGHISGSTGPTLLAYGFSMTNCLVANNKCGTGSLFTCSPTKGIDMVNCTIADNVHNTTFSYTTNGIPGVLENCIFVGNKTTDGAARNLAYAAAATNLWLTNCLIGSGRASYAPVFEANTITNDSAKFVKDGSRDAYSLKRSSPAIGKGLVQDWMADAFDIRQDAAFPRLRDGLVDIGCYQCWLDPIGFSFSIR